MKYLFYFITVLSLAVTGCKSEKQKAAELNNKLVALTDSLLERGMNLGTIIRTSSSTHEYSKIAEFGKELEIFIDAKISEANKLDNVAGSDKYKEATTKFLEFEKKLVKEAVIPFDKLNKNSSQEEINAAMQNLATLATDEQKYLNDVRVAQQEFAAKNSITLEYK
jgi:hypothetical protein